jgi:hypothetical protein
MNTNRAADTMSNGEISRTGEMETQNVGSTVHRENCKCTEKKSETVLYSCIMPNSITYTFMDKRTYFTHIVMSTESVRQHNTQAVFPKTQFSTWITALVQVQHHHKEAGRR